MMRCAICKNSFIEAKKKATGLYRHPRVAKLLKKMCVACQRKATQRLKTNLTEKNINELYAIVNGLLTSAEVRKIRKNLKLTQKEAARLCGGGPNAFSRYERGLKVPLRATSNLLRLLDKHPHEVTYLLKVSGY